MPRLTGGQAVVQTLLAEGVDTVFGIPGSHSLSIYDALLDVPEIRHVLVRHEQGAAFMADGYARSTGRLGVCLTTTGPAALNTLGALATSYGDSCPVLLLCTQIPSAYIDAGKGVYHEVPDQLGMLERVTGFSARASGVAEIVPKLRAAIRSALSGRPRPVALELPVDVLDAADEVAIPAASQPSRPAPSRDGIEKAVDLIEQSKRPILWAGGGVVSGGACAELAQLAETLQAPVLTTNLGKGALPADHPLHLGYLLGQRPVRDYLKGCDLLLAVGTRFSYLATDKWTLQLPETVIHIDIDPEMIGKNYPAALPLAGDAAATLEAILGQLSTDSLPRQGRQAEVADLKAEVRSLWQEALPVETRMIQDVRSALPRETIFAMDVTVCTNLGWQMLDIYAPRTYLYPMGGCTLGYGLPAALGAKVAHPDRPVVAICGDGGFMLTCQELATAVQYGLPVVILVFDDRGYGILRIQQDDRFGQRSEVDLVNPDFVALGKAFGAEAVRVERLDGIGPAIEAALESEKPTLIEVPVKLGLQKITA